MYLSPCHSILLTQLLFDMAAATVPAAVQCNYCATNSQHPLYAYLLSDKRCVNNPAKHKIVPYIGLASNPFLKLCAHNRLGKQYGTGSQLTKPGAGHYQLELVFGPLFHGGKDFKMNCRKSSRKLTHRILRFCSLAHALRKQAKFRQAGLYVRDKLFIRKLYQARRDRRVAAAAGSA